MNEIALTIIVLTFRRDDILQKQANRLNLLFQQYPIFNVLIVDNNADDKSRSAFFNNCQFEHDVVTTPVNLGVAGGRNLGISSSTSEILVFWDDDAIVEPDFPLDLIPDYFENSTELGALAFKSINPTTGKMDNYEFPHTNKRLINVTRPLETFRYIGVGHALRRSILNATDPYDETFFYGMEEFDLSYRIMNLGYKIIYDPRFALKHHRHESGRLDEKEKWVKSFTNKLKLAHKNLPLRHYSAVATIWFFYTIYKSRSIAAPLTAIRTYYRWLVDSKPKRSPIKQKTISYIKSCGGNLYV